MLLEDAELGIIRRNVVYSLVRTLVITPSERKSVSTTRSTECGIVMLTTREVDHESLKTSKFSAGSRLWYPLLQKQYPTRANSHQDTRFPVQARLALSRKDFSLSAKTASSPLVRIGWERD
jgi:hypothetical protein